MKRTSKTPRNCQETIPISGRMRLDLEPGAYGQSLCDLSSYIVHPPKLSFSGMPPLAPYVLTCRTRSCGILSGGYSVLSYMAYTGTCRWTGYGVWPLCPKHGSERVCPEQGLNLSKTGYGQYDCRR